MITKTSLCIRAALPEHLLLTHTTFGAGGFPRGGGYTDIFAHT